MKWIEQWKMLHRKEPPMPEPPKSEPMGGSWNPETDVPTLRHRIDELLADNDSLQERLWAMSHAMIAMAEKIEELEHER